MQRDAGGWLVRAFHERAHHEARPFVGQLQTLKHARNRFDAIRRWHAKGLDVIAQRVAGARKRREPGGRAGFAAHAPAFQPLGRAFAP